MKFCKYCNKPIVDESVWNPDKDGNGYHHSCLCQMEFESRDKRIYDKGKKDVLDKIKAEIEQIKPYDLPWDKRTPETIRDMALEIIDKYADQEPCDDAISRQAVINLVRGCNSALEEPRIFNSHNSGVVFEHYINELPSVRPQENTGHWIPVSERLPKDIKPVIVTWKNTEPESYYQYIVGKHFIGTAHYKSGKWYWYSSVTEDLLAEYGKCDSEEFDEAIEVIAWMPLPKPYEPQESEDKK